MNTPPIANAEVARIAPYDPGKRLEEVSEEIGVRLDRLMLLNANENPLGASPTVGAAVTEALAQMNRYPDGGAFALRDAIAQKFEVKPDEVIVGNGSDELLGLVAAAYLDKGRRCVFSALSFSVYRLVAQARGAECVEVAVKDDFGYDLPRLVAEAQKPETSVLFLTNPNNPTGLLLEPEALEKALDEIPESVLVVLDEAYREFADAEQFEAVRTIIARHPNVLVTRTFSKAYGLAGFRVGYGIADAALIEMLNRIRPPYNVNRLAQAAAVAAIRDEAFLAETVANNGAVRARLLEALEGLKLRALPSQTNFVMVQVPEAARVLKELRDAGILVRSLASYGLNDWIRISIGRPMEIECLLDVLASTLRMIRRSSEPKYF